MKQHYLNINRGLKINRYVMQNLNGGDWNFQPYFNADYTKEFFEFNRYGDNGSTILSVVFKFDYDNPFLKEITINCYDEEYQNKLFDICDGLKSVLIKLFSGYRCRWGYKSYLDLDGGFITRYTMDNFQNTLNLDLIQ